jgi:uncharacterized protein (DUF302 family)
MDSKVREVIEFTGRRVRHYSALNFEDVLANLRAHVGKAALGSIVRLEGTREEFAAEVERHLGDSGFMLFAEIDHSRWIAKFGIKRRLLRWILGNPLIAITMLSHDYTAGLFVPIELLLAESDDGTGCNMTYVVPSSLIAIGSNPDLLSAAEALDAKLEALAATAVTG